MGKTRSAPAEPQFRVLRLESRVKPETEGGHQAFVSAPALLSILIEKSDCLM
jgi:hypothetical protein